MTWTNDNLTALIERLNKPSGTAFYDAERTQAAAALVRLRDENARLKDALREPTEEMIVAGVKTLLTGHDSQRHYVATLWRRMFDAAIDAAMNGRK
jgi:hypothetical protein